MANTVSTIRKKFAEKLQQYQVQLDALAELNKSLQSENEDLKGQLKEAMAPKNKAEENLEELREEYAQRLGSLDQTIADLKNLRENLIVKLITEKSKGANLEKGIAVRDAEIEALRREIACTKQNAPGSKPKRAHEKTLVHKLETEKITLSSKVASLEVQLNDCERSKFDLSSRVKILESERDAANKQAESAMLKAESALEQEKQQVALSALEWEDVLALNLTDMCTESEKLAKNFEEREQKLKAQNTLLEMRIQELEREKLDFQSEASKSLQPLINQVVSLTAMNKDLKAEAKLAEQKLRSDWASAQGQVSGLKKELLNMSSELRLKNKELQETAAALTLAKQTALLSDTTTKELNEQIRRLQTDLDHQLQENASQRQELNAKVKATEDAEIHSRNRLQVVEEENRGLRSHLDCIKQRLLPDAESTKLTSEDEERYAIGDVGSQSATDESEGSTGIDFMSRTDSAYDIDVKKMIREPKCWLGRSAEFLASSELDMKEKQLESAQRDCHQLYDELKAATQHSEALEGTLAKNEAALKACEARHEVALEIIGERNEFIEQLQEDLTEVKSILKIHMDYISKAISCSV